jgi:hypothetical protein
MGDSIGTPTGCVASDGWDPEDKGGEGEVVMIAGI